MNTILLYFCGFCCGSGKQVVNCTYEIPVIQEDTWTYLNLYETSARGIQTHATFAGKFVSPMYKHTPMPPLLHDRRYPSSLIVYMEHLVAKPSLAN